MHGYGTRASLKPRGRRVEESRLVELVLDSLHGVAPTWSRASSGHNETCGRNWIPSVLPTASSR